MAGEAKLQTRIKNWLQDEGWLVVKISLCSKPGWPDLEGIKEGRTIRIEVKDNQDLDDLQVFRHNQIKTYGGEVFCVKTWDEFKKTGL